MIKLTMQFLVPVLALLYVLLSFYIGLPNALEVLVTSVGLTGVYNLAQMRKDAQYDGDLVVEEVNEFKANYSFELNGPPEELAKKSEIRFKVKSA